MTPWKCPQCAAPHDGHGKGRCIQRGGGVPCGGLTCECDDIDGADADDHGLTEANPCHNASCDHCGWGGTMPPTAVDPAKLRGWAKSAWSEGWRPPVGWRPAAKGGAK